MRRRSAALALCALFSLALHAVPAAADSIEDCEKIEAADAYNRCLARFGPPAKNVLAKTADPGDFAAGGDGPGAAAPEEAPQKATRQGRRGSRHAARGHGARHAHAGRASRHASVKTGHRQRVAFAVSSRRAR